MAFAQTPPGIPETAKSAPGAPPRKVATPKQKLSRAQVARRLYCSIMQVVRFEQLGKLTVEKVVQPDGQVRVWYDVDEVARLCKEWQPRRGANKRKASSKIVESNIRGKVSAKLFKLWRAGVSYEDSVIQTEADPVLVHQIRELYELDFEKAKEKKLREKEEAEGRARQREHDREVRAREREAHETRLERMRLDAATRAERVRGR